MTMSLMSAPNDILCLPTANNTKLVEIGLDPMNQPLAFGRCDSLYVTESSSLKPVIDKKIEAENMTDLSFPRDRTHMGDFHSIPYTPAYEKCDIFSPSTFDDPFSYQSSSSLSGSGSGCGGCGGSGGGGGVSEHFSAPFGDTKSSNLYNHDSNKSSSIPEMDTKLLGFSDPILKAAMFDDTGQTWPIMSAELYGMFFVAEDVFGENNARGDELTCYRRNLFQISGSIILNRGIKWLMNEQGQQLHIFNLEATLTAIESSEGKSTDIISVPWKNANIVTSEEKTGTAPPHHLLDLSMNPEIDPSIVSIPISWKRLQFKHATANNGRRKGLQQHYIIQINLVATLISGETVKLAEIQSGPIIVRGRSPRNFDSRSKENEKKALDVKIGLSAEPCLPTPQMENDSGSNNYTHTPQATASDESQSSPDFVDRKDNYTQSPGDPIPAKKQITSNSPSSMTRTLSKPNQKLESISTNRLPTSSPIDLSLADEDHAHVRTLSQSTSVRNGESCSPTSGKRSKLGPGLNSSSVIESADFLYEYFPLSLDDWMAPVDAVYRPHVVHHTIIPDDVRAEQNMNKRKTYFSAKD